MRAEEKELEGPELEREERTREVAAHEEEELPVIGGEELRDLELAHRSTLFDAIRLVLAGEHVSIGLLYLPQRETHALEALQTAVNGHDSVGEFVFAEDRRSLLEQALAVLQQNVTHGDPEQVAELHAKFGEVAERVAELREELYDLEEAQDEDFDLEQLWAKAEGEGDQGDKGDRPGKPEDAALDGPERPEPPRPASTLSGPERPVPPRPPSELDGPERPAEARPASTLYGDAPAEAARPASSLDGPERPAEDRPPSELAAESEAAAAAEAPKKPWWRRPFG